MAFSPPNLALLLGLVLTWTSAFGQFESDYQSIHFGFQDVTFLSTANLNDAGLEDLIMVSDNRLVWYIWQDGPFPYFFKTQLENNQDIRSLRVHDFDQNGFEDPLSIAKVGNNYRCSWYRNLNGNFSGKKLLFQLPNPIEDWLVLDLDQDEIEDLIVVSNGVWWHRHLDNNGTLDEPVLLFSETLAIQSLQHIDGNNDQQPDLILASADTIYYSPWLNNVDLLGPLQPLAIASNPIGTLQIADINGDNWQDITWQQQGVSGVEWVENSSLGFLESLPLAVSSGISQEHRWYDINGDAELDLVWRDQSEQWWWSAQEALVFGPEQTLTAPPAAAFTGPMITADQDGDGQLDLLQVRANYAGGTELCWLEYEAGQAAVEVRNSVLFGWQVPDQVLATDADGDGDEDLLVTIRQTPDDSLAYRVWYERYGPDLFSLRMVEALEQGPQLFSEALDLDFDTAPDLIFQNADGYFWKQNLGNWVFGAPQNLPAWTSFPTFTDLNSDGKRDALLVSDTAITWSQNLGGGNFAPQTMILELPMGFQVQGEIIIKDLDEDEDLDLGLSAVSADSVSFFWAINPLVNGTDWTLEQAITLGLEEEARLFPARWFTQSDADFLLSFQNGNTLEFRALSCLDNENCTLLQAGEIGQQVKDFLVQDLNDDQLTDVFWLAHNGGNSSFVGFRLWEEIATDFSEEVSVSPFLTQPERIFLTDLNGDRTPDVLASGALGDIHGFLSTASNPSFTASSLSGRVFRDLNLSGTFEASSDSILEWIPVALSPGATWAFTSTKGKYRHYLNPGNYVVSLPNLGNWILSSDSSSYQFTIQNDPILGFDFGLDENSEVKALRAGFLLDSHLCGEAVTGWWQVYNASSVVMDGQLRLELPAGIAFIGSPVPPSSMTGNSLSWELEALEPGRSIQIPMTLQLPAQTTENPAYSIAGVLAFENEAAVIVEDSLAYTFRVNCDPPLQDLVAQPNPHAPHPYLLPGEKLRYTIRFNIPDGLIPSQIILVDLLDPDLDWSRFQPLAASHEHQLSLDLQTGLVSCVFEETDSILADGGGFFQFEIALQEGLENNTSIFNQAGVYYDAAPPLSTNQTQHIFVNEIPEPSVVKEVTEATNIRIFPNPGSGIFAIQGLPERETWQFRVINPLGLVLETGSWERGAPRMLDLRSQEQGLYLIEIRGPESALIQEWLQIVR